MRRWAMHGWATRGWLGVLALGLAMAGCGGDEAASSSAGPLSDPTALDRAESACDAGEVAVGLATIDSVLVAETSADALVSRALCRWVDFYASGDAEVGDAVEADLTDALAQARVENADDAMLARIYSHRAALRRARGSEAWPSTLADLNAAVEADTSRPLYVLDRAVARMRQGDSAAAVRDLDRYLQLDTLVSAQSDLARQLREDVRPRMARP